MPRLTDADVLGAQFTEDEYMRTHIKPSVTLAEYVESGMVGFNDWSFEASRDGWYLAHMSLRRSMLLIQRCLDRLVQDIAVWEHVSAVALHEFVAFVRQFADLLHEHHDIEETIALPALHAKGATHLDRMSADHPLLVEAVHKIKLQAEFLVEVPRIDSLKTLREMQTDFRRLMAHCFEHFFEEEFLFLPLTRKLYKEQEYKDAVMKQILKRVPLKLLGFALAMSMDKNEDRMAWCKAEGIPCPVTVLIIRRHIKAGERQLTRLTQISEGDYDAVQPERRTLWQSLMSVFRASPDHRKAPAKSPCKAIRNESHGRRQHSTKVFTVAK